MCKSINGVLSQEHGVNLTKSKGFTLIEALVSLALFAIAFSGLYFFFGMAQQANNNSEKRMYLNLMTNQIIETIHAEAFRADGDILSPFVTPASYNANLSDCSTYTAPDLRHTWCTELNAAIGPHKGVHADEVRTVEVVKDETNLIVNVTLVADGGIGDKNLIKTFLSRKIAPPRRSTPTEQCKEDHHTFVAYAKKELNKCSAGTVERLTYSCPGCSPVNILEGDPAATTGWSCPEFLYAGGGSTAYPKGPFDVYRRNNFKNSFTGEDLAVWFGGNFKGDMSFEYMSATSIGSDHTIPGPSSPLYNAGLDGTKGYIVTSCCETEGTSCPPQDLIISSFGSKLP